MSNSPEESNDKSWVARHRDCASLPLLCSFAEVKGSFVLPVVSSQ